MIRATVEDRTAGLGQTLRTGRPLVGGLSFHGYPQSLVRGGDGVHKAGAQLAAADREGPEPAKRANTL